MTKRNVISDSASGLVVAFEETSEERVRRMQRSGEDAIEQIGLTAGQAKLLATARRPDRRTLLGLLHLSTR